MSTSRREFLVRSAAAAGALGLGIVPRITLGEEIPGAPAPKSLNILILGGTGFTGPEQVDYALSRGHRVTLFNRNKTRPDMFKGKVDQLIGDLNTDTSALKDKKFDVVIDNPTTAPAWVRNVAQYMKGNTGHYIFISTISVYPDNATPNADETAATTPMPDGLDPYTLERQNWGRYYGALKSRSEKDVQEDYPGKFTIIRPGLIVGRYDPSDRFTYWPVRVARGGEVLAPGRPSDVTQFIDARDLAEWTIRMAEKGPKDGGGIYNATGPRTPMPMADFLARCKDVTHSDARFTWVPWSFLQEQKVRAWRDMPIVVPPDGETAGFSRRNIDRAVAKGLTFRPVDDTISAALQWNQERSPEARAKLDSGAVAGISAQHEADVLAAWHTKEKT
ncbi:MAG TPA: NAD-dependent epimerase/dehydratase family protein [Gemmatimonadaceae bacterium]|nr:NAD-dependent epimerase/dehydratase family protein [Gemmatimonadaceae bacterium]